ncbi:phage portal family protein [Arundinibacter roseus]|uniref:Phage portal protein n=1 Tax=Arundinibacter roseus TaxID=2070510 RepID=A0A4R4KJP8_9BACT|nr:hypothetical protein [Arundinibacter roseus]TDB66809.1 hypothetical protein EZE20_06700 [Arundinibacter roseus]
MSFKKISRNVYVASYAPQSGVLVTFGKDASKAVDLANGEKPSTTQSAANEYVRRGENDDKLLVMHRLATESPNKWQFITTRRNFIGGLGIGPHRKEIVNREFKYVPVLDPAFDQWHERLDLEVYLAAASYQIAFCGELNVLLTLTTDKKVKSLEVVDAMEVRAKRPEAKSNKVTKYLISPRFGYEKKVPKADYKEVNAFDPSAPTKFAQALIHVKHPLPGQKYYGFEPWWGSAKWTSISNRVTDYYDATFENGAFLTHHVDIPDDYFDQDGSTQEEQDELRNKVLDEISNTLIGLDKANKILFTFSKITIDGRTIQGVKVTPIQNPINDEAFIKMFEVANQVQASAHGVRPDLAGITIGNQLGTSGKEIVASANYMQDYMTIFDKKLLCKPVLFAMRIDGVAENLIPYVYRITSYTQDVTPKSSPDNPNSEPETKEQDADK